MLFFGVCFVFVVFHSLRLVLSASSENHCFPCNSSVFDLLKSESLHLTSVSGSCICFCCVCFFVS